MPNGIEGKQSQLWPPDSSTVNDGCKQVRSFMAEHCLRWKDRDHFYFGRDGTFDSVADAAPPADHSRAH